jgi:hypothetical protein
VRWLRTEEDSHPTEVIRPSNRRPFPDGRGNYDHGPTAARDIEFIYLDSNDRQSRGIDA